MSTKKAVPMKMSVRTTEEKVKKKRCRASTLYRAIVQVMQGEKEHYQEETYFY